MLSVEGKKTVLMGVRTDGATVNIIEQNGLKGEMQGALQLPWLFRCWCHAHQLELACKDGSLVASSFNCTTCTRILYETHLSAYS